MKKCKNNVKFVDSTTLKHGLEKHTNSLLLIDNPDDLHLNDMIQIENTSFIDKSKSDDELTTEHINKITEMKETSSTKNNNNHFKKKTNKKMVKLNANIIKKEKRMQNDLLAFGLLQSQNRPSIINTNILPFKKASLLSKSSMNDFFTVELRVVFLKVCFFSFKIKFEFSFWIIFKKR